MGLSPHPSTVSFSIEERYRVPAPHALTKPVLIPGALHLHGLPPAPASSQSMLFRDSFRMIPLRPGILLEMSNFYCHPGRAGGLFCLARPAQRRAWL